MICKFRIYFCSIEYLKIIKSFIEMKQYYSETTKMKRMNNMSDMVWMCMCFCSTIQKEFVV